MFNAVGCVHFEIVGQIFHGLQQRYSIVFKITDTKIAMMTQQPPNIPFGVTMIHMESPLTSWRVCFTYSATSILIVKHSIVVVQCYPVPFLI